LMELMLLAIKKRPRHRVKKNNQNLAQLVLFITQ